MKKILRKILAVSASLLLLSSFVSCGEGEDDDDKSGPVVPGGSTGGGGNGGTSGADLWKDAEMLTEFANTEYNWAELKIDSEIASRLQVGSKVIFEIADCNSFSKFRVTKGWGQVGNGKIGDPSSSTPYYKIDGTKLNAKEALDAGNPDNNHPGTWENEPGEPGAYYFVVDEANLSALKTGFDIVGCFKCVKIGITNLAAKPAEDPIPAGTVKSIKLEKNIYAANPESQVKLALDFNKVKVGDKVTLKMKGKATRAFKGEFFIVDTTEHAGPDGWWGELADKYPADATEGVKNPLDVPVDFDIEHEFEINHAQWGSGNAACMLAINAVDGDDTVKMYCTEYSVTLTKGEGWNGQEEEQPGSGESGTVESVTYSTARKAYKVKLTKDIADASIIGYVLQIDNDGTKDENGLKIDISNLKLSVKVGDAAAIEKPFDSFNLIPNQWASPAYGKTDNRQRLGLTGELPKDTEITVQILSATVSNKAKAPSIIFALQEDGGSYGMLGTENGDAQDIWLPAFADAEAGESGDSEPAQKDPNVVYEQKNMTIELPVNDWDGNDHGIQCYVKLSELGITGFAPEEGETYTIYMKGTTDNASTNVSAMSVGFTISYSWENGAMDGGLDISETSLAAGVSKDVIFKGDLTNASDLAFWLYNETAGTPKTMLTLSEFKITKKVSE